MAVQAAGRLARAHVYYNCYIIILQYVERGLARGKVHTLHIGVYEHTRVYAVKSFAADTALDFLRFILNAIISNNTTSAINCYHYRHRYTRRRHRNRVETTCVVFLIRRGDRKTCVCVCVCEANSPSWHERTSERARASTRGTCAHFYYQSEVRSIGCLKGALKKKKTEKKIQNPSYL